jgi:iron complex transport system substrate-binding protein
MVPARVVSLLASGTETVAALGCGDRLVGRSHECDHPDWVRRLPVLTGPRRTNGAPAPTVSSHHVDQAALAALAPDLIITGTHRTTGTADLDDLEAALARAVPGSPRVVALEPDSLADVWRDLRRVSDALGVPERGVQMVSRLRQHMKAIADRGAALSPRPRVALLAGLTPLISAAAWHHDLVALAGGDAVTTGGDDGATALEPEALAAADPDMIWVVPIGCDLARTRGDMAAVARRAAWRALRAVREGRVFLGDGVAHFNRPGPRVAETLEILAEALHPESFRFGHEGVAWERWQG